MSEEILLTDIAGNTGTTTVTIANIDTIAPTCGVRSYLPTTPTSGNVIATLSGSTDLGGSVLNVGDRVRTCTLTGNATTCSVTISDHAGNTTVCTSNTIGNIDRTPPIGTITYSTTGQTNQSVTVTLTTDEPVQKPSGWNGNDLDTTFTKVYPLNKTETISFFDLAGNEGQA
jgi:hypothetical protein